MKVLFLLLVNAASVYSNVAHPDIQLLDEVVHWTRASGGYVSDKMEIKHIHGDLSGLFAKENIQKDEVIVDIPWNLVSRPDKGEEAEWCDTVEYVRAMITKDPSLQTPYEKYLAQRKNHHPYFWTRQGKELLNYLIKDCFPMRRFQFDYEESWNYDCPHAMEQSHRDAMMLLQTRGEGPNGFDFVPIHDLLNHRNGHHTNVNPEYDEGRRYRVVALRDIQKGEQLQNSYNRCDWCTFYSNPEYPEDFQVTPQIFELYGFVELMPQRWVIPTFRILFDIDDTDTEEDSSYSSELVVDFVAPPSQAGLNFLWGQLMFLESFEVENGDRSDIPRIELESIMTLHNAMRTAFSAALQQSIGQVSDTVWRVGHHQWYWES